MRAISERVNWGLARLDMMRAEPTDAAGAIGLEVGQPDLGHRDEREHPADAEPHDELDATDTSWTRLRPVDLIVVAVLTAVAAAVRIGGLAPSSLWLDDARVAYVSKASYGDISIMGLTSPGFMFIQKVWFDIAGFSELKAQMLPFLASTLTPAAVFLLLRPIIRKELAFAGGLIAALTTLNVKYAYHVKQYTTEVLAGVIIFDLTRRWLAAPSVRRSWALVGAIGLGCAISFPVIVLATGPIAAISVRAVRDGRQRIIETLGPLAGLAAFVAVWYVGVIRPNSSANLQGYWADFYLDTDAGGIALLASLRDRTWEMFDSLTPYPSSIVAIVCAVTFAAAFVRRFDWALIASVPLLAAAVLAWLQKAPLGGGRTDNYLLVPLLCGFIVGIDALADVASEWSARGRDGPGPAVLGATVAAGLVGLTVASYEAPEPYPQEDIRPLIEELEALRQEGDAVVLYYASDFAYALYADVDSEPIDDGSPYDIRIDDPDLVRQDGHRGDPAAFLTYSQQAAARSDRVWLLGSHLCGCDWPEIQRQLRDDLHLDVQFVDERDGAALQLWTRPSAG
jgi:hypothetical protein